MTNTSPVTDFTVAELATALRIHPMTVHRLVSSGSIQSYRIGRARRVPYEEYQRIRREGVESVPHQKVGGSR